MHILLGDFFFFNFNGLLESLKDYTECIILNLIYIKKDTKY